MPIVPDKYRGTKEYFIIYGELISAAHHQGTTTYQAIAQLMGLPLRGGYMAKETGQILGEISEDEFNAGRPMLSAIAVGVSGKPGPGFYAFAEDLGKLTGAPGEDKQRFWEEEKAAVYAEWKREFKS